ncbi:MAG: chemotaxis protein CheW [Porticoccus sp.]|nr:chemotaxis protein CheW [Porticoccus sp.]
MDELMMQQKNQRDEVDSLFVQLGGDSLLVPMSAVAEVVQHVNYEPQADAPAWLQGWVEWRKQRIPLISFETLSGVGEQRDSDISLALVMNNLNDSPNSTSGFTFYAIQIQAFPHLVRISEDDQLQEVAGTLEIPHTMMKVGLDEWVALIPDLDSLEKYLSENL